MKRGFEVIILKKQNIKDFSNERNNLLSKAKREWIFFLDSDERMSEALESEIQSAIKNPSYSGYYLKRNNYFLGSFVGTDRIVRLARKNSGIWKRKVHETWKVKGKLGELKNPIIHNTSENLFEYIKKINHYSTLHAQANRIEGKKSTLLKIIFFPIAKFFLTLIKSKHVVFSLMQSFHSFLSWTKLYFLHS